MTTHIPILILIFTAVTSGVLFISCVATPKSEAEQRVEYLASKEKAGFKDGEIASLGYHTFFNSEDLTDAEKKALLDLHSETFRESAEIRGKIARYKAVLFKLLVSELPNEREIQVIKNKISDLYMERLKIMLASLDKAKKVLGKDPKRLERLFRPMLLHSEDLLLQRE